MTPKLPLTVGSYDDGGQVSDSAGYDLFTFGCNDDDREMDEHTQSIADWVMYRLNNYDRLARCLEMIAALDEPCGDDAQEMLSAVINAASNALKELK